MCLLGCSLTVIVLVYPLKLLFCHHFHFFVSLNLNHHHFYAYLGPSREVLCTFSRNAQRAFSAARETKSEYSAGVEFQCRYSSQRFGFSQLARRLGSGLKIGQVSASVELINRLQAVIESIVHHLVQADRVLFFFF